MMPRYNCRKVPGVDLYNLTVDDAGDGREGVVVPLLTRDECRRQRLERLKMKLVAAYIRNNSMPASHLPDFIRDVHASIETIHAAAAQPSPPTPQPAVPIKGSVKPDYIVSLEDGRRYKSLRRHLSRFGLTPEAYRQKWQLPADYPMVAPNYSKTRAALAKSIGLGQKKPAAPVPTPKPSGRGKRK